MTAGSAGPLGLVEETYAAAENDLAGFTSFQLIRGRVAVDNRDAGTGPAIRAGRICFSLSHDAVLVPCNDRSGHVPGAEGQPTL